MYYEALFKTQMPSDAPAIISKDFVVPHWMSERTVKINQRIKDYVRDTQTNPKPVELINDQPKVESLKISLTDKFSGVASLVILPAVASYPYKFPIQKQININQAIPTKNPQVFELIINSIVNAQSDKQNITEYNLIDLGIVPLNLNMLMKDVSLFNITFNSALYKKFMTSISSLVSSDSLSDSVKKAKRHFMDIENNSLGLAQIDNKKIISMFEANDAINSLLKTHVKEIEDA